jgi:hypothetical protein
LIAARELQKSNPELTTKVVHWQEYKGIDDAAKANLDLDSHSIAEWMKDLGGEPLREVKNLWEQLQFVVPQQQIDEADQREGLKGPAQRLATCH